MVGVTTDAVVPRRELLVGLVRQLVAVALRRPVLSVFVVAVVCRLVVAVFVALRHDGFLFEDDRQYVQIAADKATGDTESWDDYTRFLYNSNSSLTVPMTLLFRVFGVHPVIGELQVLLFGALAAALVTRLALELPSRGAAVVAGMVVAVLPSQVLFSSLTLKDALVWAALAALAVAAAVIGRTAERRRLVLLYAGVLMVMLMLAGLRKHTLVVAAWSLFFTSWAGAGSQRLQRMAVSAALAIGVPLAVGAGVGGVHVFTQVNPLETQRALGAQGAETAVVAPTPVLPGGAAAGLQQRATDAANSVAIEEARVASLQMSSTPEELAAERARLAALRAEARELAEQARDAAAAAHPKGGIEGLFGEGGKLEAKRNLAYLPRGLSVMLLQPYPWSSSGNSRLQLARAETVLWYPLLLLAALGLLGLRRWSRVLAFPVVVGGGVATMWALVEGNFGTAYRHRGEFVWAMAVLAAAGFAVAMQWWRGRGSAAPTDAVRTSGLPGRPLVPALTEPTEPDSVRTPSNRR